MAQDLVRALLQQVPEQRLGADSVGPAGGSGGVLPEAGVTATVEAGARLLGSLKAHSYWSGLPPWDTMRNRQPPPMLPPSEITDEQTSFLDSDDDESLVG